MMVRGGKREMGGLYCCHGHGDGRREKGDLKDVAEETFSPLREREARRTREEEGRGGKEREGGGEGGKKRKRGREREGGREEGRDWVSV